MRERKEEWRSKKKERKKEKNEEEEGEWSRKVRKKRNGEEIWMRGGEVGDGFLKERRRVEQEPKEMEKRSG